MASSGSHARHSGIGLQKLATRRLVDFGTFRHGGRDFAADLRGFDRDDERNTASAAESRTLDEPARQEIERLPGVLEAYPDIRFITELRYQDKPHLTMVSGIPDSARTNDAFSLEFRAVSFLPTTRRGHSAKVFCHGITGQDATARRKTMSR